METNMETANATARLSLNNDFRHTPVIERILTAIPRAIVPLFTLFFLAFALLYVGAAMVEFVRPILDSGDLVSGLVKGLHMGVVALPVYELAQIIYQEYDSTGKPDDTVARIHRSVTRFASIVFVALVLESLIMVIKYSQQDLAGFLLYPVAIIVAASLLLLALGVFIRITGVVRSNDAAPGAEASA
jgi:hypothetical protein